MSNIEWTDKTWNPVIGCTPVSPGCLNCYAATMANRCQSNPSAPDYAPRVEPERQTMPDAFGVKTIPSTTIRIAEVRGGRAVFTGDVRTVPERLGEPLHWRKPRRVFVNSMSDLFHESVPFEFIDQVFAVMALCPQHTFQVLTKRPERMAEYFNGPIPLSTREECVAAMAPVRIGGKLFTWGNPMDPWQRGAATDPYDRRPWPGWPLRNVWLGTSVEDQPRADERIQHLSRCPAAVHFLSCEPLLGPIDIPAAVVKRLKGLPQPSWVIVGGESGPGARPCDVGWIRSIVKQCKASGVPCFVKQLGARPMEPLSKFDPEELGSTPLRLRNRKGGDMSEWPEDLRVREFPVGAGMEVCSDAIVTERRPMGAGCK